MTGGQEVAQHVECWTCRHETPSLLPGTMCLTGVLHRSFSIHLHHVQ